MTIRNFLIHDLKCWPEPYAATKSGKKTCEIRLDDRGFQVDDILLLREWNPTTKSYTGDQLYRQVTHIERLSDWMSPPSAYVVMSVREANVDSPTYMVIIEENQENDHEKTLRDGVRRTRLDLPVVVLP